MSTFIYVVRILVLIYAWLIVARVVLSWFPARFNSPIYGIKQGLSAVTEPYLRLFRRFLPITRIGNILLDLSALVGMVTLFIIAQVLARL